MYENVAVLNVRKQGDWLCYEKYNIWYHDIGVGVIEKKYIIFEQQFTLIVSIEVHFGSNKK